jgi:Flp pilus assembly pilin Flp
MQVLQALWISARLRRDERGQDLVEYAFLVLMVSFVIYGWLPTNYVPSLSHIWARVQSVLVVYGGA